MASHGSKYQTRRALGTRNASRSKAEAANKTQDKENVSDQSAAGPSDQSHNANISESPESLRNYRFIALGLRNRVPDRPDMQAMPKQTRDVPPAPTKKRKSEALSPKAIGKRKASEDPVTPNKRRRGDIDPNTPEDDAYDIWSVGEDAPGSLQFVEEPVVSDTGDGAHDPQSVASWTGEDIFEAGEDEDQPAHASVMTKQLTTLDCECEPTQPSKHSFYTSWDEDLPATVPSADVLCVLWNLPQPGGEEDIAPKGDPIRNLMMGVPVAEGSEYLRITVPFTGSLADLEWGPMVPSAPTESIHDWNSSEESVSLEPKNPPSPPMAAKSPTPSPDESVAPGESAEPSESTPSTPLISASASTTAPTTAYRFPDALATQIWTLASSGNYLRASRAFPAHQGFEFLENKALVRNFMAANPGKVKGPSRYKEQLWVCQATATWSNGSVPIYSETRCLQGCGSMDNYLAHVKNKHLGRGHYSTRQD